MAIPKPPNVLNETRSLWLRRTMPEDAELLFHRAYSQPEFMHLFRLNTSPPSIEGVREKLIYLQNVPPDQDLYLELLIIHKQHGPIGICTLEDYLVNFRRAEYLVGLFDNVHRGLGYGLQITLMVLELAFNRFNLNKVVAIAYGHNKKAQQNLENVGFVLESKQRQHIFDRASQQFVDLYSYGMLSQDYRQDARLGRLGQHFMGRDITQPGSIEPLPSSPAPLTFTPSGSRQFHG